MELIENKKPDLVLLDIQMPDGTGFDLLQKLNSVDFKLVFITAHEQYALKAIKFSAVDYILKPIDIDELITSIEKIKKLQKNDSNSLEISTLLSNIKDFNKEKKIILKTTDDIYIVKLRDIIRLESDQGYTNFHLARKKKIIVSNI